MKIDDIDWKMGRPPLGRYPEQFLYLYDLREMWDRPTIRTGYVVHTDGVGPSRYAGVYPRWANMSEEKNIDWRDGYPPDDGMVYLVRQQTSEVPIIYTGRYRTGRYLSEPQAYAYALRTDCEGRFSHAPTMGHLGAEMHKWVELEKDENDTEKGGIYA